MTTDEKLALIRQVGEEIVTEEDLKKLLESGEPLVAYDGFEPSGQMHIAQGLVRTININKMTKAGFTFKMLVADWHGYLNNKMGGDLQKIQTVGKYFIEVWKAAGMDLSQVEFVWASDLVKDPAYWELVMKIAKTNAIRRFIRAAEIMGREESMDLTLAQLMYIAMQAADIFTLDARVTQLGMDQRKVNMLAREVGPQLGYWKPIVVSHHMLMGLQKPADGKTSGVKEVPTPEVEEEAQTDKVKRVIELKMSKSNPDSAIFMTDSVEDVERKVNKAYCPEGVIEENPILEYCRYIIFPSAALRTSSFVIERPEKFGGTVILNSFQDLSDKFAAKELHPQDLKIAVARELNKLLEPVRAHFAQNVEAKRLLEEVQSYQITR